MISGKTGSGLQYAVKRSGSSVAYCALSIRCGTRDEEGFHSGIAHFVEHTIFKGTERRSASVINGYLDRLGGELNAAAGKVNVQDIGLYVGSAKLTEHVGGMLGNVQHYAKDSDRTLAELTVGHLDLMKIKLDIS